MLPHFGQFLFFIFPNLKFQRMILIFLRVVGIKNSVGDETSTSGLHLFLTQGFIPDSAHKSELGWEIFNAHLLNKFRTIPSVTEISRF